MKYTTTRGIEIEVLAIPMMLVDKVTAAHKDPEPPTYEVPKLGGGTERHSLADVKDRSSLSDSELAQLAEWDKQVSEVEANRNRAFTRLIMLRGIRLDMPTDESWIAEHRLLGVTVPDDSTERRLHYIETEVFGGVVDYQEIMRLCMTQSGVDEAVIRQASDLFRGRVEGNTDRPVAD